MPHTWLTDQGNVVTEQNLRDLVDAIWDDAVEGGFFDMAQKGRAVGPAHSKFVKSKAYRAVVAEANRVYPAPVNLPHLVAGAFMYMSGMVAKLRTIETLIATLKRGVGDE